jgi:predicted glycogen debranching enzyme
LENPGSKIGLAPGDLPAPVRSPNPAAAGKPAPAKAPSASALLESEERRRKCLAGPFEGKGGLLESLAVASDRFLVRRSPGHSVLAGYPWFEDWGRDTFISLPGLALTMGRHAIAAEVLAEFARFVKDGMLPNRFPDFAAEPEYNSVDAPLWFIHSAGRFLEASDDLEEVRDRFLPVMEAIVDSYRDGTRYGIAMDEDGLIAAGEPGMQLTWMDARYDGVVFTPRHGKPVEIQALWHSALCTLEAIHYELDNPTRAHEYGALAARVRESFLRKFWREEAGICHDVVDDPNLDGASDPSLRPNQLFAAALPYPLLDAARTRRMLEAVRAKLLTPVGLRTLSPTESGYLARYQGGPAERDAAYHNGTVWPWLLGAYCDAVVTANSGWQPAALTEIRAILAGFEKHLSEAGLGGISEIFEPEPPYTPVGCTHQAWSVAELLRIAAEVEKHE